MGIEHSRKQGTQAEESCHKCGVLCIDAKKYASTSFRLFSVRRHGDRMSNDMQCPIVKQFRADLTRTLLVLAAQATRPDRTYGCEPDSFPPWMPSQRTATENQPSDATHAHDEFPPVTQQCTVKANSAGPAAQKCEGLTQQMIQTSSMTYST